MKSYLLILISGMLLYCQLSNAQCTPTPNPGTAYGANNVWIGYVYNTMNLTGYVGYVNEGTAASPNFDQSFGGNNVSYPTSDCNVTTERFSVRYRLRKNFANGVYEFTVGADDGVRLSLDGGATWVINEWHDQTYTTYSYTTSLNGNVNMVLEYYENTANNRVSFSVGPGCLGTGSQTTNGANDVWRGYVYDGTNFNTYKGVVLKGVNGNPNFDEDFGGANVSYATNQCPVQTETFSVRYRLRKYFTNGTYTFTVGGDDGFRLSLDGGSTWVIDRWFDQSYTIASYTTTLNGNRNMVLEYYENTGDNRITFLIGGPLPIKLLQFDGRLNNGQVVLNWKTTSESTPEEFVIERGVNGQGFAPIGSIKGLNAGGADPSYSYIDASPLTGISFYRLKMIDRDGRATYSPIVTINPIVHKEFKIYPTVVGQERVLFVQSDRYLRNVNIALVNTAGQVLLRKNIESIARGQVATVPLNQTVLPKGIYLVQVSTATEILQKQPIIVP